MYTDREGLQFWRHDRSGNRYWWPNPLGLFCPYVPPRPPTPEQPSACKTEPYSPAPGTPLFTEESGGAEHTKNARPSTAGKHEKGGRGSIKTGAAKKAINHAMHLVNDPGLECAMASPPESELYDQALSLAVNSTPDVDRILALLTEASSARDPRATYALATWYLHGTNVRKNIKKAALLLEEASAQGNREAMFDLAVCYKKGRGREKDLRRAFLLYLESALSGDNQALYEVYRCYWYGIGVERDRELAIIWRRRAEAVGVTS